MSTSFSPRLFFIFLVVCLLPQLVFVWFRTTSITIGLLIACGIVIATNSSDILKNKQSKKQTAALAIFFMILLLSSLNQLYMYEYTKPIYSLPAIIVFFTAAIATSRILARTSLSAVKGSILSFSLLLISIGWLKIFYTPTFFNYDMYPKAVFPYSEESHFALSVGMIACVYTFIGDVRWSIFIMANVACLGFIYPNLTIIVFLALNVLAIMIRQRGYFFKALLLFAAPILSWFIFKVMLSIDYFETRLDFDAANNLTTMVFLQGWQLAYLNFFETYGIGLGFQGLGSGPTVIGDLTQRITSLTYGGESINLSDGGFLAAKIIAEFGTVGVIGLICYLAFLFRGSLRLAFWYSSPSANPTTARYALMFAFLFAFFVEVFFRGLGYFSPGLFFALAAGVGLVDAERPRRGVP